MRKIVKHLTIANAVSQIFRLGKCNGIWMWDLIVSVPGHCLSFYFNVTLNFRKTVKAGEIATHLGSDD